MDAFGSRLALLSLLDAALDEAHRRKKAVAAGQGSLFDGDDTPEMPLSEGVRAGPDTSREQRLAWEKDYLGVYLTEHPMARAMAKLAGLGAQPIGDITAEDAGKRITIAGMVSQVKRIMTKAGNNEMAFVRLEDLSGSLEAVVFPKIFAQTSDLWNRDSLLLVSGKVDEKDGRLTMLVDGVNHLDLEERSPYNEKNGEEA